jgi:hypothetical protein
MHDFKELGEVPGESAGRMLADLGGKWGKMAGFSGN